MAMERIIEQASAVTHKVVSVTPSQLRQLALRLETMAKEAALPGDWVTCQMTRSITLAYDPNISASTWRNASVQLQEQQADQGSGAEEILPEPEAVVN